MPDSPDPLRQAAGEVIVWWERGEITAHTVEALRVVRQLRAALAQSPAAGPPSDEDVLSAADHLGEYAALIAGPTERLAVKQLAKRLRASAGPPPGEASPSENALREAFDAMVVVTPQGQPCYRTANGIPQGMPKAIERKVRRALSSSPTAPSREGKG